MVAPSREARPRGLLSTSDEHAWIDKKDGHCPCINTTGVLASLSDRRCRLPSGKDGIQLKVGGSCAPFSYGSSFCLRHDLRHDPDCQLEHVVDSVVPQYCFRPWCYVDFATCKTESHERIYRSDYFPFETGVDLFYSYSVCNSTAEDWLAVRETVLPALGGVSILATAPTYLYPSMFKKSSSGDILSTPGGEYYDDSIPFEGAYINYARQIMELSKGDIQNITMTHNSKVSSLVHPTSTFTAAIQDIQDGLADMAIGPFWITGQRLKMASFTIPIVEDKTFLVIPRPGTKDTPIEQAKKVLEPFSYGLWGLVIGIITATALLSVWFSDRPKGLTRTRERGRGSQIGRSLRRRKSAYSRLALDSCLQKGLFFCSAGVEQDAGGSLPNQLLMFGFGFFILIIVSTYVANLAAFLTLSSSIATLKNMQDAVEEGGVTICAHPALQRELSTAWPKATFYFHEAGREFHGMLEDYENNKCKVMAVGWEDTGYDTLYHEKLCKKGLVYTEFVLLEMPVAFPIRRQLESGLSYWILQGETYHKTSVEIAKEDFSEETSCNVHYSEKGAEASEHQKIYIKNMFLPIAFFSVFMVIAVLLQVCHRKRIKSGRRSLAGRISSIPLVASLSFSSRNIRNPSDIEIEPVVEEDDGEVEEGEGNHQDRIEERAQSLVATSVDLASNWVPQSQHPGASLIRRRSPDVQNRSEAEKEGGKAFGSRHTLSDVKIGSAIEEENGDKEEGEDNHEDIIKEGKDSLVATLVDLTSNRVMRRQQSGATSIRRRSPNGENESEAEEEGNVKDAKVISLRCSNVSMRSIMSGDMQ